ncbi:MAG: hypothetical protein M3Q27_08795 [Actinomycetota bacterium]|nr:hypothetical protein [Actinomycetota bacterium]
MKPKAVPRTRLVAFAAAAALLAVLAPSPALAHDVQPTPYAGNLTCKQLLNDAAYEIKVDPPKSGSYGPLTVTFSPDGKLVAFTSTVAVLGVFVKGGNEGGNFYDFRPKGGTTAHSGLAVPTSQQISHVSFCWDEEPVRPPDALNVEKTAVGTYDRTITWKLAKSASPTSHSGNAGHPFSSTWTVTATKEVVESNFKVTGTIDVSNPNAFAVPVAVTDKLDDGTSGAVDCDPVAAGNQDTATVAAKASVSCTYSASPPNANAENNNAVALSTDDRLRVPGGSDFEPISWSANRIGDDEVTLADERFKYSKGIGASVTETFPETFTCPTDGSRYDADGKLTFTETNVATLKGDSTNLSKNATVTVTCSLPALTAVKTADGSYTRTVTWTLDKTVDKDAHTGVAGQSFQSNWKVAAGKSDAESGYMVTGSITVSNPAKAAQAFTVKDVLDDRTEAAVDCDRDTEGNQAGGLVPADGEVVCTYTASPANRSATMNTATVTFGNRSATATKAITWSDTLVGDDNVTLADERFKYSKGIGASVTETFPETFTCPTDGSRYDADGKLTLTETNVATLKGDSTNLSKNATVTVTCTIPRWADETATGAGKVYPGSTNWFMYTPYTTAKVDLIAGQKYDAGDIYMTRNSTTTFFRIVLHDGWRWADVAENLKIQPFDSEPKAYVEPGTFRHKFTVTGQTVTVSVPGVKAKFYGVHGDMQRRLS